MRESPHRLLPLLLGDASSARAASREISRDGLWRHVVALGQVWRVIPRLRRRLRALDVSIEAEAKRLLDELSVQAAVQSTYALRRAADVLQALQNDGVAVAAFKGIGLLGNLYGGPAERMVQDIDLLIHKKDLGLACQVIQKLEFTPSPAIDVKEFIAYLKDQPHPRQLYCVLRDREGLEIDLQWRMGIAPPAPMDTTRIIARAQGAQLFGTGVWVASPVDAVALTAEHVLRNSFAPYPTVKDLCDLAAWFTSRPEIWEGENWIEHLWRCHLSTALSALCGILASLDPAGPARQVAARVAARLPPRERRAGQRLSDLFRLQLDRGPVHHDLLRILNPRTSWRFLLSRIKNRPRNRKVRSLIQKKLGKNRSAGSRILELLSELFRLSPRRLLIYRTTLREYERYLYAADQEES